MREKSRARKRRASREADAARLNAAWDALNAWQQKTGVVLVERKRVEGVPGLSRYRLPLLAVVKDVEREAKAHPLYRTNRTRAIAETIKRHVHRLKTPAGSDPS